MIKPLPLAQQIYELMKDKGAFKLSELQEVIENKPYTTIRARVYDNIGSLFKRIGRGVYVAIDESTQTSVVAMNQDGRDLSFLTDGSIDAIITDHPYEDAKSNVGGSRKFVNYDCFKYTEADWREKFRVLKPGGFLVEFFAEENANNYRYIYSCKEAAEKAGFVYYCIVPWRKGTFVANTGRKSKNMEQVVIFSKGKPRCLRPDKQRGGLMSGAAAMLPTELNFQPAAVKKKIHPAEKPVDLLQELVRLFTLPGEVILDQFAGSGNLGVAAVLNRRFAILLEKSQEKFAVMCENIREKMRTEHLVTVA